MTIKQIGIIQICTHRTICLHIGIDENSLKEHYFCICVWLSYEVKIQLPRMQHESDKYGAKWHQNLGIFANKNMSNNML